MHTWFTVTSAPRIAGGDSSAMYMGTVEENTPITMPVRKRPAAICAKPPGYAGALAVGALVTEWAGGEAQAMAWYRSQPIPALDRRTPEALVKSGQAGAVRDYLDHMALGGFA